MKKKIYRYACILEYNVDINKLIRDLLPDLVRGQTIRDDRPNDRAGDHMIFKYVFRI